MCGIYLYCRTYEDHKWYEGFKKIQHRGPDSTSTLSFVKKKHYIHFGFHRLSIVGVNDGFQPFNQNGRVLVCNGEIYNYEELIKTHDLKMKTHSDCEVILALYVKYGMEKTIKLISGEYAFILLDGSTIYFNRDDTGVRPLFYYFDQYGIYIASEAKCHDKLIPVEPRYLYSYSLKERNMIVEETYKFPQVVLNYKPNNELIKKYFIQAVQKKIPQEVEMGILLSGGLDSSLICSVVCDLLYGKRKNIKCFSIGLEDSDDVKRAKLVVEYLKKKYSNDIIEHHIVPLKTDQMLNAVSDVVYATESYDTTTIRASTPMFLLAKYIKQNTKCKVILSGEGADELLGGYIYFHKAPNIEEFRKENRRLLSDLYIYDNLRADRCMSYHSLELRVPFLDKEFLEYMLKIDTCQLVKINNIKMEKGLMRLVMYNYLPEKISRGQKDAFSDAVGHSWKKALRQYGEKFKEENKCYQNEYNPENVPEDYWLRYLFNKHYPNREKLIPYYWIPKWCDTKESSATELDIYRKFE